jgi:hypothetical protein
MKILDRLLGRPPGAADEKRVRLDEVMRLRRISRSPLEAAGLDAAAATKRCMECPRKQMCDEAIRAGDANALSLFCPNAHYVEYLRSRSLKFA